MSANSAPITPSVLTWAMEDAGMSLDEVATGVDQDPLLVRRWIAGDAQPNLTQLHKIAKTLARPESFFFLPSPPKGRPLTASFRTHPAKGGSGDPTSVTYEALRHAERVVKIATWASGRLLEAPVKVPVAAPESDPELIGNQLRSWLGWDVATQIKSSSEAKVSQALRRRLQDWGLVVLHLTLDEYIVRGFSLADPRLPLIAVNTRDTYPARIFSYVHELAHLARHDASICLTRDDQGIEHWCNQVAGSFLLPKDEITAYVKQKYRGYVSEVSQVSHLKNRYKVSLRAVTIRLIHLGLAGNSLYAAIDRIAERKPGGGRGDPDRLQTRPRRRLQNYGRRYVQCLLDAESEGVLQHSQVLEFLRVSGGELEELRGMISVGEG